MDNLVIDVVNYGGPMELECHDQVTALSMDHLKTAGINEKAVDSAIAVLETVKDLATQYPWPETSHPSEDEKRLRRLRYVAREIIIDQMATKVNKKRKLHDMKKSVEK